MAPAGNSVMGPRRWGAPLWRERRLATSSEGAPTAIDVAVIGGGLTGMSAAFHLARRGVRTAVFEADSVGQGASGRTGGIVLEGTATGIREGADRCVPALARLVADLGIECDLALPGCWEIEHQQGNESTALPWHDRGDILRIEANRRNARIRQEAPLRQNAPIRIVRTVAGGSVEPRALLFGMARAAQEAGALVIEHQPVRRIDLQRLALELDQYSVDVGHIVVAVNAWTTSMLSGLPPIQSALTYACATEPLSEACLRQLGLGERIPFYTLDRPYLWGRVAAHGEIVFGAGLLFAMPEEVELAAIGERESTSILDRLENRVRGLNPLLARVRIAARWAGPIAFTDDAIPLLGAHPVNPAVLVAGAYAGHGVAFSVRAGEMLADAIVEGRSLPHWGRFDRQPR